MKKRVLILTDYCGSFTGFGKQAKNLCSYLYKNYSDKIEIVSAACGMPLEHPDYQRFPWITSGVIPNDPREIEKLNRDQNLARMSAYGDSEIENLVYKYKIDIILIINDQWGCSYIKGKSFFGKIPVIFYETLDSTPIQEESFKDAKEGTLFWVWSQFAVDAMKKVDPNTKAQCQYPCLNTENFYRLSDGRRSELRQKFNIHPDCFIINFCFRNQSRKLVNKLIEGYSIFKLQHPEIKNTKLLLHTSWSEGWNIPKLAKEYNVDLKEILCTYICRATREYFVMPFQGQNLDNPKIPGSKSLITVNIHNGISEDQLNEVYNLCDCYIHPATSGACEIPCVESALTELPIATCNYSFGEDIIALNKGSFPIDFFLSKEFGSEFNKSNPSPNSIAKIIHKIYSMKPEKRRELGKLSRQWAIENYSTEINGKKIAETLLSIPAHSFDFNREKITLKNDKYPLPQIEDETEWLKDLYKNILSMELPADDTGLKSWISQMANGRSREDVYKFFISVAQQDNLKAVKFNFDNFLSKEDEGKRILVTMPESAGDCILAAALLEDIKSLYPDWHIYFACKPEYFELLEGNPYIFKMLPWIEQMDNLLWLEGQGNHKGYFQIAYLLHSGTQRYLTYLHNGADKTNIEFNI